MIALGKNVRIVGFKEIEEGQLASVKQMVEKAAAKFALFDEFVLTRKPVHSTPHSQKHELQARLVQKGHVTSAETVSWNLLVGVDEVLSKLKHV